MRVLYLGEFIQRGVIRMRSSVLYQALVVFVLCFKDMTAILSRKKSQ